MKDETIKQALQVLFEEHNLNKIYKKLSIVTYTINGDTNIYQAIKDVPRLVSINNSDYWKQLNYQNSSANSNSPDYLCFTANKAGATLRLVGFLDTEYTGDLLNIEYSTDKETWINWEIEAEQGSEMATTSVLTFTNAGDKVYLRGNNINGTTYLKGDFNGYYYSFVFSGADDTHVEDNSFAVSGDLQTLVDKTGQDKEHGCFGSGEVGLFMNEDTLSSTDFGITITTAPDLTATKIVNFKYTNLFAGQTGLTQPAKMPTITTADLPQIDMTQGEPMPSYSFSYTYRSCTSLQRPADLSHLTLNSMEEVTSVTTSIWYMYMNTNFNITDDGGATLTGLEGITFPITMEFDEETKTIDSFMFAQQLGNINGFPTVNIFVPIEYTNITSDTMPRITDINYYVFTSVQNTSTDLYIFDLGNKIITGWQESTDGENWTDVANSDSETIQITVGTEDHYYRPVVIDAPDYFRLTALEDNCSISMHSSFSPIQNMEYSTDNGQTWNAFVNNGSYTTINLDNGDYALFRGENTSLEASQFIIYGEVAASGKVNTLFNKYGEDATPISMYGLFGTEYGGEGIYDVSGLMFPSFSPIYGHSNEYFAYSRMFAGSPCTMSQDGEHFIFSFPITLPVAINPGTEYEVVYSDELDIAIAMGNVKGFQNVAMIHDISNSYLGCQLTVNGNSTNIAKYGDTITLSNHNIDNAVSSYITFVKWQVSTDNETWQDIPGATTIDCSFVNTYSGDIWLKPVFTYSNLFAIINYVSSSLYFNTPTVDIDLNGTTVTSLTAYDRYICVYNQGDVLTFSPSSTTVSDTTYNLTINDTIGDTITLNSAEPFNITIDYKN